MNPIRIALALFVLPFAANSGLIAAAAPQTAPFKPVALTAAQKQFLSTYETIETALAADNLFGARAAAAKLPGSPTARDIANTDSLNQARMAFKRLSRAAVEMTKGRSGYYVMHCPMVDGNWVQTTTTIANPYIGKKMLRCGELSD